MCGGSPGIAEGITCSSGDQNPLGLRRHDQSTPGELQVPSQSEWYEARTVQTVQFFERKDQACEERP